MRGHNQQSNLRPAEDAGRYRGTRKSSRTMHPFQRLDVAHIAGGLA
jgi:hypothetical protein